MRNGQFAEILWHISVAAATYVWMACTVFVVWYSQYNWRETEMGRHLMRFTGIVGLAYGLTALFAWMAELGITAISPVVQLLITVGVFIGTAILVTERLLVTYEIQRDWELAVRKAGRELVPTSHLEASMDTYTKPQPILKWMAALAGLDVILGGSALANFLPPDLIGFLLLLMSGIKVAVAFYLRGQVVPLQDVGAYITSTGRMAAGPAAAAVDGTTVSVQRDMSE